MIIEKLPSMQRLSVICVRENHADYAVTMHSCLYDSTEDTTDNVEVAYNIDE